MRLTNLDVQEISVVDKAANKKKFAFIKRDTQLVEKADDKKPETASPAPASANVPAPAGNSGAPADPAPVPAVVAPEPPKVETKPEVKPPAPEQPKPVLDAEDYKLIAQINADINEIAARL